ncbi:hypothetical protein [Kocuria coralli]|uniref:hypothetical protein n=1 Tax=Kocuria coralli TaxID=1461025 RepID=UPI0015F2C945|nr:hypothetical protein [Kocuria coralli]
MGFSLARSGNTAYRGYLRSGAWFRRRRAWFTAVKDSGREAVCQVCGTTQRLDLHHMNYDGVSQTPTGAWVSGEADEDLMPLCRTHHEQLHEELDRRRRDFWGRDRRRATAMIVVGLRKRRQRQSTPGPRRRGRR